MDSPFIGFLTLVPVAALTEFMLCFVLTHAGAWLARFLPIQWFCGDSSYISADSSRSLLGSLIGFLIAHLTALVLSWYAAPVFSVHPLVAVVAAVAGLVLLKYISDQWTRWTFRWREPEWYSIHALKRRWVKCGWGKPPRMQIYWTYSLKGNWANLMVVFPQDQYPSLEQVDALHDLCRKWAPEGDLSIYVGDDHIVHHYPSTERHKAMAASQGKHPVAERKA